MRWVVSPVRTKRQAQAADRREQLLRTAFQLFSERGYRGTSVRDIARTVGVTEGLLYHYFTSKVDLFTAVLTTYAPLGAFDLIIESAEDRPVGEVLREVGHAFLTVIRERRSFAVTILAEAPANPELGAILGTFVRHTCERLAGFLARHRATGQIDPTVNVETAAQTFLGGLFLCFLSEAVFAQVDASDSQSERAVNNLVQFLLSGFTPRLRG